jgi:hypothetical protein
VSQAASAGANLLSLRHRVGHRSTVFEHYSVEETKSRDYAVAASHGKLTLAQ